MKNQPESINFLEEIANFTFTSKYAKYDDTLNRRETWDETVSRVENMHLKKFRRLNKEDKAEIKWAFSLAREKKVVPSMRSMQFAGKAIESHESRIYNCCVLHVDSIRSFAEAEYLLLCGCGVGFGLSEKFLSRLPDLVSEEDKTGTVLTYVVQDNIEGWADSIEVLLSCYFRNTAMTGRKIVFDYSKIRPAGAILKTGGGKAPGYKGLKNCHIKIKQLLDHIIEDEGVKRMRPVHAYDILMHGADAVLSGGIRRSATCVIFDKSDAEMMEAKTDFTIDKKLRFVREDDKWHGKVKINKKTYEVELTDWEYENQLSKNKISWIHIHPQRARSNNSVLLVRGQTTKEEFSSIINKTREYGEPGFVFGVEDSLYNPCFEVSFIPVTKDKVCGVQFCNLSSINGAKIKTEEDFLKAVKAATIIGTLQASYTNFKYLRPASKQITEEESLLGVSITGMMDSPEICLDASIQRKGAELSVKTNKQWAKILGINPAARVTVVKPEGTSSLVLGAASGIHPHHARRYFRRIQCNKMDNVFKFFKSINPHACEESVWSANKTDDIATFPLEINEKSMVKSDLDAIKHLEIIKSTQKNWVIAGTSDTNEKPIHHNVSCTVIVKDNEWEEVISYIFDNQDFFSAVSLLPFTGDKIYKQAPMEAVLTKEDEAKWAELIKNFKSVNYSDLEEGEDLTAHMQELSCAGGKCEI